MARLLRIDASSRGQGSHSRELANFFQKTWIERYPDDEIVLRDLAQTTIPHLDDFTIAAFQTPDEKRDDAMKQAITFSDELIDELLAADVVLLSVPMYNFSVPSALKAYIDQIVRMGRTFSYDPATGFSGLVTGKKGFTITAAGALYTNSPFESFNFLDPYLKALWAFLGVTNMEAIALEGTTTNVDELEQRKQAARERIQSLIAA
ncbi:MAG: NAD(P)H-dependent oxidoreductase [Cyanobacteria bacterium J06642_2]